MELAQLIVLLSSPSAYAEPAAQVEVRQTHISTVFLVGRFAYKIKKPVRFDFLDFSTLVKRRHFCAEEVRLNRRLAPDVYLGVVPITAVDGDVRVEGAGAAVEWAVKMQRLPEEATLHERVRRGEVGVDLVERLGRRIAAFHREAVAPPDRAAFSRFEAVARNLRDVFEQSAPQVGNTVSRAVWERTRALIEDGLSRLRPLIEARSAHGMTRDTHGDLHLDHVYHFPERQPPADLIAVDCIEFSEQLPLHRSGSRRGLSGDGLRLPRPPRSGPCLCRCLFPGEQRRGGQEFAAAVYRLPGERAQAWWTG